MVTMVFWTAALGGLGISVVRRRSQTKEAFESVFRTMCSMAGGLLMVLALIGLVLAWVPPASITGVLVRAGTAGGTLVAALAGGITLIPAFAAFPLVGTFLEAGTGIVPASAFLTTLTMVGVATFPLESRTFGVRYALLRNALSFVFAVLIAVLMGVIL